MFSTHQVIGNKKAHPAKVRSIPCKSEELQVTVWLFHRFLQILTSATFWAALPPSFGSFLTNLISTAHFGNCTFVVSKSRFSPLNLLAIPDEISSNIFKFPLLR
jgi:hypothetical protein